MLVQYSWSPDFVLVQSLLVTSLCWSSKLVARLAHYRWLPDLKQGQESGTVRYRSAGPVQPVARLCAGPVKLVASLCWSSYLVARLAQYSWSPDLKQVQESGAVRIIAVNLSV